MIQDSQFIVNKLASVIGDVIWTARYVWQGKHINFRMQIDLEDPFDQRFESRSFALELIVALRQLLRRDDLVVDAGAQKGYVTLHAASLVGRNGKVFSFEPDSRSRAVLLENCRLNRVTNVFISDMALGETSGIRQIKLSSQLGWSSFYPNARNKHTTVSEETVVVQKMDDVLAKELGIHRFNLIKFVKIDCEGSELEVLRGMQTLSSIAAPIIWVEINTGSLDAAESSEGELLNLLTQYGYRTYLPKVELNIFGIPCLTIVAYYGNAEDHSHRVFDVVAVKDDHLGQLRFFGIHVLYKE